VAKSLKGVSALSSLAPDIAREPPRGLEGKLRRSVRWWNTPAGSVVLQVSSLVIFLVIWELFGRLPRAIPIPTPDQSLQAGLSLSPLGFLHDCLLSFYRVGLGFLIGAIIGIPLGVVIGYSPLARGLLFPAVEVLRPVPPIAWIPLALLFFPNIEGMIVFLTFYGAFFPIVYNTIAGMSGIPEMYIHAARSLGSGSWTLFWRIMVPAMLPSIFTGLHIAIGIAWLMVVAGEMVAVTGGIGALTWQAYQTTHYPLIFVGMAAIGVLGYVSSQIIRALARFVIRWDIS
jgi:NitT/TauT family transport system permease protein